jgi:hypothetical protein
MDLALPKAHVAEGSPKNRPNYTLSPQKACGCGQNTQLEAKLFDEVDCLARSQRITKTAQQTSAFLLDHCNGDNERLTLLMAKFVADAVFEQNPDDLLYWACVYSRCKGASQNGKARRELLSLLEHTKRQAH